MKQNDHYQTECAQAHINVVVTTLCPCQGGTGSPYDQYPPGNAIARLIRVRDPFNSQYGNPVTTQQQNSQPTTTNGWAPGNPAYDAAQSIADAANSAIDVAINAATPTPGDVYNMLQNIGPFITPLALPPQR